MAIFKVMLLTYMHIDLYGSFYQANSKNVLYKVHKYNKMIEYLIIDLIHLFNSEFY